MVYTSVRGCVNMKMEVANLYFSYEMKKRHIFINYILKHYIYKNTYK